MTPQRNTLNNSPTVLGEHQRSTADHLLAEKVKLMPYGYSWDISQGFVANESPSKI